MSFARWAGSLKDIRVTYFKNQYNSISHLRTPNPRQENLTTCASASDTDETPLPLLGPPEIYLPPPPPKNSSSSFIDLMVTDFNKSVKDCFDALKPQTSPPNITPPPSHSIYTLHYHYGMGYTENASPTFLNSGNPCLDFFFHVVPNTPSTEVQRRLNLAWDQDPLTTLKLVCNLLGVRGTGKADREGFYSAALWLHENHPKTLACNAKAIVEFGYFKNLLEILYRLLEGPDVRSVEKADWERRKMLGPKKMKVKIRTKTEEELRIEAGKKGVEKYNSDPLYRLLHNKTSLVFAEALKSDLENLRNGKYRLSWAAKWCPSLYSHYDRATLLCESIARRLFPKDLPEYAGIEDAHYTYRIRDRLRKEVLVPLRKALKLPEVYMSARQWNELPYTRVPSVAMKLYKELFLEHDHQRFKEFLGEVKKGKKKIAAGALYPHEIIAEISHYDNDVKSVAELQWQRIVDDLSAIGKLNNCLAICDVSGSMFGMPMDVSVALGLLVSELTDEPWKGKLITFSRYPQLHVIEGNSLSSKANCVKRMDWEMNTDFQKVFDKILEVAKNGNLSEDQMIKRLFVFSDMEFDEASANPWETDYQVICKKFNDNGYSSVPEIVFWNLRESKATPVPSHQPGVALLSGFSKNFLKLFLNDGGIINPLRTMEKAIAGEEYNKLVIVD